ncbi:MAG: cache domain-containing protein, partial [Hydrogenophaga sp.]|nr:cache domain-containing protein [Hydrogenophaga sp.]
MRRNALRWLVGSVRNKLLAMALLPLLVVFPLLVLAIAVWSSVTYDRLLITKVRSDLAVARGYFDQTLAEVGSGTRGVARSHRLLKAMEDGGDPDALLAVDREELGLDFLLLYRHHAPSTRLPASVAPLLNTSTPAPIQPRAAQIVRLSRDELATLAPSLLPRLHIPLVDTRNAAPDARTVEDRALVLLSLQPVQDADGRAQALLIGGLLLNQNLDFIDHINRIVYPDGALPFGSEGTATLFLDDVRITTNVRLFQDRRAIGTRVSQTVRERVLDQGQTWLDRAFVVNDWYVSA